MFAWSLDEGRAGRSFAFELYELYTYYTTSLRCGQSYPGNWRGYTPAGSSGWFLGRAWSMVTLIFAVTLGA